MKGPATKNQIEEELALCVWGSCIFWIKGLEAGVLQTSGKA